MAELISSTKDTDEIGDSEVPYSVLEWQMDPNHKFQ